MQRTDMVWSKEAIYWIRGYLSGDGHALGRMASSEGAQQPPERYKRIAEYLMSRGFDIDKFDELVKGQEE